MAKKQRNFGNLKMQLIELWFKGHDTLTREEFKMLNEIVWIFKNMG